MMALHPGVAQKIQQEIDQNVGRDRIPNLADRDSLPYLDAALQEALRIAPPLPLGKFIHSFMV
jgi:cytochrome P450